MLEISKTGKHEITLRSGARNLIVHFNLEGQPDSFHFKVADFVLIHKTGNVKCKGAVALPRAEFEQKLRYAFRNITF